MKIKPISKRDCEPSRTRGEGKGGVSRSEVKFLKFVFCSKRLGSILIARTVLLEDRRSTLARFIPLPLTTLSV